MKENQKIKMIETLDDLALCVDYSLIQNLNCDLEAKKDGIDYEPRQVFKGHYVSVKPTPIPNSKYIAHSEDLFKDLGFSSSLATSPDFVKMFSGDLSSVPSPLKNLGWACGYALSIYGTEYYHQCPFGTGNGYGDGRAISIVEGVFNNKRWEMQLKGGGKTPYCRGADGRAVLRSSVREFLAQEHMHSLGIPTSRSLSLFTSSTQKVRRPWFSKGSYSKDPDMMILEDVAITTRVAPSFIRVGQIELFARRARKNEYPSAMNELEKIVLHLINREYKEEINEKFNLEEKILLLASAFKNRLTSLIANWIRVGYCQGNFNSDNCAAGGFTLDYGPFGFCDLYDPSYQPWTSGGDHFSFLNQTAAAENNFYSFCNALEVLLSSIKSENKDNIIELNKIKDDFSKTMQEKMQIMWASKLGLSTFNKELFDELEVLMVQTSVDYTIFFRELSSVPNDIQVLTKSFYKEFSKDSDVLNNWMKWLEKWNLLIRSSNKTNSDISKQMKLINPKYTLREWFLVPAYEKASIGDYSLVKELQKIMNNPYEDQDENIDKKYYSLKPAKLFELAGVSHVSCSS